MKKNYPVHLKLGITGGIGSGKTTVCRVFSVLGIPVFSTDPEAKQIMDSNPVIRNRINSLTGKDLYVKGTLNRPELARLIFNDPMLLQKVNSIVHPAVFDRFREWEAQQNAPYVILEAAILFESGASVLVDRIATVIAPLDERVDRVIKRNKLTRDQVLERAKNQLEDDFKIKNSDYIIYNSENDMIIPAILSIHEDMLSRSGKLS